VGPVDPGISQFEVRNAAAEDAPALAALYQGSGIAGAPAGAGDVARLLQTGHAFLVAVTDGAIEGAVRVHDEDGICWFDLLAARRAGAGRALVRGIGRAAQDRGLRLVRAHVPDDWLLLEYFARLGFRPVGREAAADGGPAVYTIERRVPLLTVREQRRADADAIEALTGADPWPFTQGTRPGWFVAADGDRVVGVISCADGGGGLARVSAPMLAGGYGGRGLDVWMAERAALYAQTNGYHTAEMPFDARTASIRKPLEDRFWYLDGARFVRVLAERRADDEDTDTR